MRPFKFRGWSFASLYLLVHELQDEIKVAENESPGRVAELTALRDEAHNEFLDDIDALLKNQIKGG